MCGIAAAYGTPGAVRLVRDCLQRLEYRGYDSSGIAWLEGGALDLTKTVGAVRRLDEVATGVEEVAMGHTRWATHGAVDVRNAHPHVDATGRFAVVHNGTLDGAVALRSELEGMGTALASETDSECIAHLYGWLRRDHAPMAALRLLLERLQGTYAFVLLDAEAGSMLFARQGAPLVASSVGGTSMLASDVTALLPHTRDVLYLEDGEHGVIDGDGLRIFRGDGRPVDREPSHVDWSIEDAERSGHAHFMAKEIHETPAALNRALGKRIHGGLEVSGDLLRRARRVVLVGCGSSLQAARVGAHLFEAWAHLPAQEVSASRLATRPLLDPLDTLHVVLTQSGETRDVIRCVERLQRKGYPVLAVTNVRGSTVERAVPAMLLHVGPEVAVAATKTYAAQIACCGLLALETGVLQERLAPRDARQIRDALERLPRQAEGVLGKEDELAGMAQKLAGARDIFVLGRAGHAATAAEAALKLKEIAYVHAEGFDAAELKHGPQALLQKDTPCLFFLGDDEEAEKTVHNIMEVSARGAPVYAIRSRKSRGATELDAVTEAVIELDAPAGPLAAVVHGLAAQLLAYHVALGLHHPIDRPRHLAKSVTVD